jgi:adenosylhomocysteine nucleosidase
VIARYDALDGPLRVLFVMAAEAEYGPALRGLIQPLVTGVGPVEAAIHTARALAHEPADLVVSLGSAGSRTLPQAAVFQASLVSYRDMDASLLGFERGRTPFLDLPAVVTIPQRLPGVPAASLSTGGAIIGGDGYDAIAEDMVDMETFAVLRAANLSGAGMIGLRGISDGAEPIGLFSDWTRYLAEIDLRLADIVRALPEMLAAQSRATWSAPAR